MNAKMKCIICFIHNRIKIGTFGFWNNSAGYTRQDMLSESESNKFYDFAEDECDICKEQKIIDYLSKLIKYKSTIFVCHEHRRIRYGVFNWNDTRYEITYDIVIRQPNISSIYNISTLPCDLCKKENNYSILRENEVSFYLD